MSAVFFVREQDIPVANWILRGKSCKLCTISCHCLLEYITVFKQYKWPANVFQCQFPAASAASPNPSTPGLPLPTKTMTESSLLILSFPL